MNSFFLNKHGSFQGILNRILQFGLIFFLSYSSGFAADLKLAWNASPSAGVAGYKLYIGSSSKNYTSTLTKDVGNVTAYTMTGLTDGSTYYFALKAYNATRSIESAYSNEVSTTMPTTPTSTTLTVDFTPSTSSGVAPLSVTFTPITSASTAWRWDFPGSSTPVVINDSAKAQVATYSKAGTYSIGLTVYGASGNLNKSKQITVTAGGGTTTNNNTTTNTTTDNSVTNTTGLVAAYGFEDFGSITADASGLGNHGTVTEATRSYSGYSGNALKFDGVNDWVTVNDSASLDLSSNLTIEAWVNPSVTMSNFKTVLMKEQTGNEVYALYANSDLNKPMMGQWTNGVKTISGESNLTPNKWSHIAATYDGIYQRFYVNGIQVNSRAQTGSILQSNGALRIGGNSVWGEYFNGLIDEVKIYNRRLSNAEISQDYLKAVSTSNPPLLVVGNKTLEPKIDSVSVGSAEAFKTTPTKQSAVTALQVYLDGTSTATEIVAGIYSDNGGHPGTLLNQGRLTSPKAGATNTIPIYTTLLTAGKPYWIALLGSKGQVKFRSNGGTTNPMEVCASTGLTSLPVTWTTGKVGNDGPMSIYGTGY